MNIDFSLWLLVLSAVTGLVWLGDALVLARKRRQAVAAFLASRGVSAGEFDAFAESLDEDGKAKAADAKPDSRPDPVKQKVMEQALALHRESVPVEYAKSFFPILFAVLLLRSFLFEPFQIPTGSMIPTLNIGDFIVVNKFAYGLRLPVTGTKILDIDEPKRGDVMVFIPPHDPNYFIKRVIGMPGDHVRYADNTVYINGEPLPQEDVGLIRELGQQHSLETVGGVTHDIYTAAGRRGDPRRLLFHDGRQSRQQQRQPLLGPGLRGCHRRQGGGGMDAQGGRPEFAILQRQPLDRQSRMNESRMNP
jgi:signal peptidase I